MKNKKLQFFAQYFGQDVFFDQADFKVEGLDVLRDSWVEGIYARLKPLSQINDEDSIEVSKLEAWNYEKNLTAENLQSIKNGIQNMILFKRGAINTHAFDFLRSKGYAIPFLGMSVEEMEKLGWIKIN